MQKNIFNFICKQANNMGKRESDKIILFWPISDENPFHKVRSELPEYEPRGWFNADANKKPI